MPSTQEFRRRIKSVNNTKQITKAMEMIASIKMQKAVKTAGNARSYTQNSWNMLETLAKLTSPEDHKLLMNREVKKTAIILITSDRGLCGSYNSEVLKKITEFEKTECSCDGHACDTTLGNCDVIALGKKGAEYVKKYKIGNLIAEFPGLESNITFDDIVPIAKLTIDEYLAEKYDRVVAIYSHFESSLKQTPVVKQILPITPDHIDIPALWESKVSPEEVNSEFKFEPSPDIVLERILPQLVRTQIFGSILEANASEHSARMVAMKSATDNAKNLIDELQLVYNTVRQGNITREIAEISGAAESMK